MSEAGLKPCPFCGSTKIKFEYLDEQFKDHNVFVTCDTCKSSSAIHLLKGDAVAAWNSRVLKVGQGDCVKCADEPDESCKYYGEPNGCNRRSLAEIARKVAAR